MLVEEMMQSEVVTLSPTAAIADGLKLRHINHIKHIPIVDETNQIIGIVSDRDLRIAAPSIFNESQEQHVLSHEIQSIMSHPVVTVHPLDLSEEVAHIFYDKDISCLPVVSDNKLIGMITASDMLYTLIQLTGTNVQSSQIEIKVPHKPGVLPEAAAVFGKRQTNITSVLLYPYNDDPNYKILVFRIQTINPLPVIQDLRKAGYTLMWPNNIAGPKQ
ncbi:acetoin utilization AcuB family protein [Barrientosiimonas marina]|uniref:Acetoin utilization AcuB family protein n=1 Tax=Lentibacillus kimchii TaxID=1542911 RepID=A0ABW2UT13_9BACI